tara:strand:- start:8080 stop:8469 length:390 start_codon:yes stop_codon:yes gene_type:complete
MKSEKDLQYTVKLEKVIKDKYGEVAIKNPADLWSPEKETEYLQQLVELREKENKNRLQEKPEESNGFLINKKLFMKNIERTCPVCRKYTGLDDQLYMTKYACCSRCHILYVEDREERWQNGWRPNINGK